MPDYRKMLTDRAREARALPELCRSDHIALQNRRNYACYQQRKYLHSLGYPGGVFHVERTRTQRLVDWLQSW